MMPGHEEQVGRNGMGTAKLRRIAPPSAPCIRRITVPGKDP